MSRPKTMDSRKLVSLPGDLTQEVEDYRFSNRIKTESEAIRRLIAAGLKAEREAKERQAQHPSEAT